LSAPKKLTFGFGASLTFLTKPKVLLECQGVRSDVTFGMLGVLVTLTNLRQIKDGTDWLTNLWFVSGLLAKQRYCQHSFS